MEPRDAELCTDCLDLVQLEGKVLKPHRSYSKTRGNVGLVMETSSSCLLCRLMLEYLPIEWLRNRFPDFTQAEYTSMPFITKMRPATESLPDLELYPFALRWASLEFSILHESSRMQYVKRLSITTYDVDPSDSSPPRWKAIPTSTDDRLSHLKTCYQYCKTHHAKKCNPLVREPPTRLVDVGSPLRLIRSENLTGTPNYATLSHCWGASRPLLTTKATLESYTREIQPDLFPRTFKDAIHIARELNIPYLWIDSLCIVQDDLEDWQREASKMQEAYSGSSLTIAAVDARDSSGGCFGRSDSNDPGAEAFFSIPVHKSNSRTLIHVRKGDDRLIGENAILNTRGWVLQESILSRRTAHCMHSQLIWQCQTVQLPETGHAQRPHAHLQSLELADKSERHAIWCKWIENYSQRKFSFPQDRMAAILGIMKYYQSTTGDVPILGLWDRSICPGLSWVRLGDLSTDGKVASANLPSWSWLACHSFLAFDFWSTEHKQPSHNVRIEDHTTLLDYAVVWTAEPFVSELVSARLVVNGPALTLRLSLSDRGRKHSPPYLDVNDEVLDFASNPLPWRCAGQFDNEDWRPPATYLCLLVRTFSKYVGELNHREYVLLLEEVEGAAEKDTYRRVGIATFRGHEWTVREAPRRTVVLV